MNSGPYNTQTTQCNELLYIWNRTAPFLVEAFLKKRSPGIFRIVFRLDLHEPSRNQRFASANPSVNAKYFFIHSWVPEQRTVLRSTKCGGYINTQRVPACRSPSHNIPACTHDLGQLRLGLKMRLPTHITLNQSAKLSS